MSKTLVFATTLSLLLSLSASAHDQWANGDPVPKWVKEQCCGVDDVHRLTDEDVTRDSNGNYHIKGYPNTIPAERALPSHDGYYWAFYQDYSKNPLIDRETSTKVDSGFSGIYCFFVPLSG